MTRKFDPADLPPSPDLCVECGLWEKGFPTVAGLDEAGRGAWAGPVSAGAVIFPPRADLPALLPAVRDSKQMTPAAREFWAGEIRAQAAAWAVGFASNLEIDALGIVPATRLAMQRAVAGLAVSPVYLLIDALLLPNLPLPQISLIKGDARALSIAAASVLAKTARDDYMREIAPLYPEYDFARHKGYGTALHAAALGKIGPCAIHRYSFAPVNFIFKVRGGETASHLP
jgi:ribonuclease HII